MAVDGWGRGEEWLLKGQVVGKCFFMESFMVNGLVGELWMFLRAWGWLDCCFGERLDGRGGFVGIALLPGVVLEKEGKEEGYSS